MSTKLHGIARFKTHNRECTLPIIYLFKRMHVTTKQGPIAALYLSLKNILGLQKSQASAQLILQILHYKCNI
jgi:hypothetical protein